MGDELDRHPQRTLLRLDALPVRRAFLGLARAAFSTRQRVRAASAALLRRLERRAPGSQSAYRQSGPVARRPA